jgi:hypothetical protein
VVSSQIFSFFLGFLFQSIQVTFGVFGFGVAAILVVRDLIFPDREKENDLDTCKAGRSPLADVQPTPSQLASAEGDEREATMTVDIHASNATCNAVFMFSWGALVFQYVVPSPYRCTCLLIPALVAQRRR